MIKFVLLANKHGQTRLSQYYRHLPLDERASLEADVVRKCLSRNHSQCNFFDYQDFRVVFRRYAALFIIIGCDTSENELSLLEFIHLFVEALDMYFKDVCELHIMNNLEKVHIILEEMISHGEIVETNRSRILAPIATMDTVAAGGR